MNIFKKTALISATTMAMASLMACGDDSSSSSVENPPRFVLDEENQNFKLTFDLCYISEDASTRWDEYVYTKYYHYKLVDGYLLVYGAGTSADDGGVVKTEFDDDKYSFIMKSSNHDDIFGTWESVNCNYEDGEIDCENTKDNDLPSLGKIYLKLSRNDIHFYAELNEDYCPAKDIIETEEIDYIFKDILDDVEVSASLVKCNSAKLKVNGKSIDLQMNTTIGSDNVVKTVSTYTADNKTCSYTEKMVNENIQYPQSVCNANDMEDKISKRKNTYVYDYDNDRIQREKLIECLKSLSLAP